MWCRISVESYHGVRNMLNSGWLARQTENVQARVNGAGNLRFVNVTTPINGDSYSTFQFQQLSAHDQQTRFTEVFWEVL